MRAVLALACTFALGCSKHEPAPPAGGSAAPAAPAAPAKPSAHQPPPAVDCSALVTAADVEAACKQKLDGPQSSPSEKAPECNRWFRTGPKFVSMIISDLHESRQAIDHLKFMKSQKTAEQQHPGQIDAIEDVAGVGDAAFYTQGFEAKPLKARWLQVAKGRWEVTLKTNDGNGTEYACDRSQLETLARTVVSRLP